jgi:phosphoserine aminotransferase
MTRIFNFGAGPGTLPTEVLQQIRDELLDWHGLGVSIMEISHRSPEFEEVAAIAEQDLRDLLNIPSHYKVLFLQGGGRGQFSMVPLNLLGANKTADYFNTGFWSKYAIEEARKYGEVNVVADTEATKYRTIPVPNTWHCNPQAAYLHFTSNETINGVEFQSPPNVGNVPLVADMSSNILSRPIDVSQYGLIYASAQKNIGPAGLVVVIVREDLLGKASPLTPSIGDYKIQADFRSLYNTPPTFAWYIAGLVFKWLKRQGGIAAIAEINRRKAEKLYHFIDAHDFYHNPVDPNYRSWMNVIFNLADETCNPVFLTQAKAAGLIALKGHKLLGGMRASIYNAMPEQGVDALIAFMTEFAKKNS